MPAVLIPRPRKPIIVGAGPAPAGLSTALYFRVEKPAPSGIVVPSGTLGTWGSSGNNLNRDLDRAPAYQPGTLYFGFGSPLPGGTQGQGY